MQPFNLLRTNALTGTNAPVTPTAPARAKQSKQPKQQGEPSANVARTALTLDEITAELAKLPTLPAVTELTGSWVWITFAGMPDGATIEGLKKLGCWWSPKHKQWYRPLKGKHFKAKASGWDKETIDAKYNAQVLNLLTA